MSEMICPKCQYVGKAARKKRGSAKLAFGAWLIFPFGLPYTLWRMLSTIPVCRHCGNEWLIAANSAVGKKLLAKMDENMRPPSSQPAQPAQLLPPKVAPEMVPFKPARTAAKLPSTHKDPDVW